MTQNLDRAGIRPGGIDEPPQHEGRPGPRWPWYRNPWLIGVAVLVVVNLLYALPRYLPLDPSRSRVPIDPKSSAQFPLIIVHLLSGNIAMVTVFLQLLPGLRRTNPNLHRISGRIYVFAGVLPAAGLGLVLLPYHVIPFGQVGLATEAVLWITVTVRGFWMQHQGRYAEHRRWMIYSFALAMGTTWARVLFYAMTWIPALTLSDPVFLEVTSWLGWIVNLCVAHWWLDHTSRRAQDRQMSSAMG